MRWKHGEERRGLESGCCWCFHVRTGAIIMGIVHLIWYILIFVIAGFFMVLKKQLSQAENPLDTDVLTIDNNTDSQGDAVSLYLNTFKFNKMENNYTWDDDDQYFSIAVIGGCILCSVLLIYGAAKGEGGYLMPFFILKVFTFSLGCLYMVSFCGGTWAKAEFQFNEDSSMDVNYPFVFMSAAFVIGVWLEAYFAYVAWACYRYLRLTGESTTMNNTNSMYGDEASEMLLPPKYEDIILIPADDDPQPTPPPAYQHSDEESLDEEEHAMSQTRAVVN